MAWVAPKKEGWPWADWLWSWLAEPGQVRGGPGGCHRHSEHGFASCVHTVSEWPLTTGAWLHQLAPETTTGLVALVRPRDPT